MLECFVKNPSGASSGIGAAVAAHFARLGAHLSLTGRNEPNLYRTVDECVKNGLKKENVSSIHRLSNGTCTLNGTHFYTCRYC
jgi:NAD(P)-dependent dehydrogenase (short-subunit alcohol dehydrogenase family)